MGETMQIEQADKVGASDRYGPTKVEQLRSKEVSRDILISGALLKDMRGSRRQCRAWKLSREEGILNR